MRRFKAIIVTLILFTLVIFTFAFPSIDRKSSLDEQIVIEKQAEANYIMQDALITSKLNLQPNDLFTEIESKQQLRMYTVTHLQNNRWKTIPTKYNPQKKLSLNIEKALPNIQPEKEEKGISHYIKDELVIKFKENVDDKYINNLLSKYDLKIKKRLDHAFIVTFDNQTITELINELEEQELKFASSKIEYIEPHFIYLTNEGDGKGFHYKAKPLIPNDSLYLDYQWNLPLISTEEGWRWTKGTADVLIAVIDTGVDLDHSEFKDRLVQGINIIDPSLPPMDDDGHGTHVAGIISANTNNNEGIAGITWYNKIMPIKVLDQAGAGTLFDVAEGIFWATDHGAKVINLSLGNYAESKFLHDAIKYAYNNDVVLVAATGNDNTNEYGYPAAYPEVISVSAIDYYQRRAEFSNYGNYVDVVAPGVNIPSTYPNNQYASLSGTSMSSPHVAGLAGLLRAVNPSLTNARVNQIIKETAYDLGAPGKDPYYGYGAINIEKAITTSKGLTRSRSITLIWLQGVIQR